MELLDVKIVASGAGGGGGASGNVTSMPHDPERQIAKEVRRLLDLLAHQMNEARKLDMRVSFNVGEGDGGVYVATADIVKVIS